MLQNKIYQNFTIEIIKNFLMILFGLSLIALTVRAVSFLDLIVENGYLVSTYFKYSVLNLFGIAPKFIPLSFLLALIIFILKHIQDNEFVILWTSGVKKIQIVNLFFFVSLIVFLFYLLLTTLITPLLLNKSRQLLNNDNFNSFLPTVRAQQFSDSFKGFTFLVEKKENNEIKNIFLHDENNSLKNISPNSSDTSSTTIIAKNGILNGKRINLFNGQIISTSQNNENEIIKFDKLNIDLSYLSTTVIKKPKIQETSTIELFKCFFTVNTNNKLCEEKGKKEVIQTLNKRITSPFYVPILSLICALLFIKSKKFYLNKASVFLYGFILLLFTELAVRYTGISKIILIIFNLLPLIMTVIFYIFLSYYFSKETIKS